MSIKALVNWSKADQSKLLSAFEQIKLDLKNAVDLGVLNGSDEEILLRTLGDPTSLAGQFKGMESLMAAADQVQRGLNNKLNAIDTVFGDVVETRPFLFEGKKMKEKDLKETPKYREGMTATGPDGQKIIFRNGRWVPMT